MGVLTRLLTSAEYYWCNFCGKFTEKQKNGTQTGVKKY